MEVDKSNIVHPENAELTHHWYWFGLVAEHLRPYLTIEEQTQLHNWSHNVTKRLGKNRCYDKRDVWPTTLEDFWESLK